MAEPARKKMTVEEFFEWQERQDKNYELVDGVPVLFHKAMTGASRRHDAITVNAIANLHRQLRGKPCRPSTSDQSVRTWRGTRRPDVSIDFGRGEDRSLETAEPRVVIEVLSPSTMRYDLFQTLDEYKQVATIQVILLVDVEQPRVSVWRRGADGWRFQEESGLSAVIGLPEVEAALPLAELFEGLEFPVPDGW